MHRFFLPLLLLAVTSIAAVRADERPTVVSTNTIAHDLVTQIGGDAVRAHCLLPIGSDPHAFEPKPADVRFLAKADLVVVNGLGFETWISKLVNNSGFRGPIVTLTKGITPLEGACESGHHHGHHHDHSDPHAWQNIAHVVRYVENLRAALAQLVPAQAEAVNARAAAYTSELEKLHAYATETLAALPAERRKIVTSHDSLAYLGEAYGLTITPISGLSSRQEPNARQVAKLITLIREQKVPAIFIESTTNPKLSEMLAREAGIAVPPPLHTDSVGPEGTPAATYLGMMRHNIDTIAAALR